MATHVLVVASASLRHAPGWVPMATSGVRAWPKHQWMCAARRRSSARSSASGVAQEDDGLEDRDAYHVPVMVEETVNSLVWEPNGVYVDGTLGGGGHSAAILSRVDPAGGMVIGIDRDLDAISAASQRLAEHVKAGSFVARHACFQHMESVLRALATSDDRIAGGVSGILLDLGVSSFQIDEGSRGFSFRFDAPLDMRMDTTTSSADAGYFLNACDLRDLAHVLRAYGEEKFSGPIARAIVEARPLVTTGDLVRAIEGVTPSHKLTKTLARVFQAVRIHTNDELSELRGILASASRLVKPGGRLAVISYHSLEDRPTKNTMRAGNLDGEVRKDEMGNVLSPWRPVTRKPLTPSDEEIEANPRSRSAKLRVAQRTEVDWNGGVLSPGVAPRAEAQGAVAHQGSL